MKEYIQIIFIAAMLTIFVFGLDDTILAIWNFPGQFVDQRIEAKQDKEAYMSIVSSHDFTK